MEQAGKDILDRNASEKMCSLVGNEAGEICSSEDADTRRKRLQNCSEIALFLG